MTRRQIDNGIFTASIRCFCKQIAEIRGNRAIRISCAYTIPHGIVKAYTRPIRTCIFRIILELH